MMKIGTWLLMILLIVSCSQEKDSAQEKSVADISLVVKDRYVYDNLNLLDTSQIKKLNEKLFEYYKNDSTKIKCFIIESFDPYVNEVEYGKYLISLNDKNDIGLIYIILFINERTVVIRTNKIAESKYTNSTYQTIIDSLMVPQLKQKKYYKSFVVAIDKIESI